MINETFHNGNLNNNFRILKYGNIEPENYNNPICILGMPGIADIGKFAVDQLVGILNAEKIIEIICFDYPAGAIIDESVLTTPKTEILLFKDKNKKNDIILVTADAQAMTPRGIYEISDLLSEILYQFGIKEIIALGAYPVKKNSNEDPKIFVTKTDDFNMDEYKGSNCKKINKGVIIGANGLIPTIANARFGINGTVYLVETEPIENSNEGFTDLKASILLLEFLTHYYKLPIESVFTNEKVSELSKDLEEKRKNLEKELESYQPVESIEEQGKTFYI